MIKSLLVSLLILITILVSGCGSNESNKVSASKTKYEETKVLKIQEKIEQLGNEGISTNNSQNPFDDDKGLYVFEKGGITYVIEPSYETNTVSLSPFKVNVSVLKGNKWIVKNKVTDLTNDIWDKKKSWTTEYLIDGINYTDSSLFITTTVKSGLNNNVQPIHRIYKITFGEDGVAHDTKIMDKTETQEGDFSYDIVNGLEQPYFIETINNFYNKERKYNVLGEDGNKIFSINSNKENLYTPSSVNLINHGILYFGSTNSVEAYSPKDKDLIWNSDGSRKSFVISNGIGNQIVNLKNGIYSLGNTKSFSKRDLILTYTTLNEKQAKIVDTLQISSKLDVDKAFISVDDKNVVVYTLVEYKGQPSIQKYIIPRIDI